MDIALYMIVGMITFSSPYLCWGPKASSKNRSCSPADKLPQDRPMAQILQDEDHKNIGYKNMYFSDLFVDKSLDKCLFTNFTYL